MRGMKSESENERKGENKSESESGREGGSKNKCRIGHWSEGEKK